MSNTNDKKKIAVAVPLEEKIIKAMKNMTFVTISTKNSGEAGYIIGTKTSITGSYLDKDHDAVMLQSARLVGSRKNIEGWLNSSDSRNISESCRHVIMEDLKQAITWENYDNCDAREESIEEYVDEKGKKKERKIKARTKKTAIEVTIYALTKTHDGYGFSEGNSGRSSFLFLEQLNHQASLLKQKKSEDDHTLMNFEEMDDFISLAKAKSKHIIKTEKIKRATVKKVEVKVPVNTIMEYQESAMKQGRWVNVSGCQEDGRNIHLTQDKPKSSSKCFVFDYPGYERLYFTLKMDKGVTSPWRGVKNMGPAHCLHNISKFEKRKKSIEECIEEVAMMVKAQKLAEKA